MHCDSLRAPQQPRNAMINVNAAMPTNTSKPIYESYPFWVIEIRNDVSVNIHPNRVNAAIPAACGRKKRRKIVILILMPLFYLLIIEIKRYFKKSHQNSIDIVMHIKQFSGFDKMLNNSILIVLKKSLQWKEQQQQEIGKAAKEHVKNCSCDPLENWQMWGEREREKKKSREHLNVYISMCQW